MEKLLTISVAAYNVEKYLYKTLESCIVFPEYYSELEVLIVNDGSRDSTLDISKSFVDRYPEIFKILDKDNGGYGSTINTAVQHSVGKFFRLLDGDDWYDTNELMIFLDILRGLDVDLVLNDFTIYNEKTKEKNNNKILDKEIYGEKIEKMPIKQNWSMYSFCYRTELLRKNKINISERCFYTDIEFMFLPLVHCKTFSYYHNSIYCYRIGVEGQSVSLQGMKKNYRDTYTVVEKLFSYIKKYECKCNQKENLENIIIMMSIMMIKSFMVNIKKGAKKELRKKERFLLENNEKIHRQVFQHKFLKLMKITSFNLYFLYPILKKLNLLK